MSGEAWGVWLAILGSIAMGLAAACVFILSVKRNLFDNLEEAKYQIFWADRDEPPAVPDEEDSHHVALGRG